MNLKAVAEIARQHVADAFAADPGGIRLDGWLYDDHLMVWSLTIGFAPSGDSPTLRTQKVVRVSETNRSVLSVKDP
jgi:hypothetical protein